MRFQFFFKIRVLSAFNAFKQISTNVVIRARHSVRRLEENVSTHWAVTNVNAKLDIPGMVKYAKVNTRNRKREEISL